MNPEKRDLTLRRIVLRVLLVDDENEMVTTLAERLTLRAIDADCAFSGKDAVTLLKEKMYDIVVLDMKMPGMSGLETMEQIQKIQPETEIIFLTGHGSLDDCEASKKGGAYSYLLKPVDIDVLIEKMREAVVG